MKNIIKTSMLLTFTALLASGCGQTTSTTNTKKSTSTTTNTSTTPTDTTTTPTTINGCADGVYRTGSSQCYYTNLPRMVFSGPGSAGIYWSSANLANEFPFISPNQFMTDSAFAVRMKPSSITNESSRQGRTCSLFVNQYTKLRVEVMVRRQGDSLGETKVLTGNVNQISNVARFSVPGGTSLPYIVEVVKISSDNRCKIGSLTAEMVTGCNAGTYFADIPVNSVAPNPTTCVAFNLEFATDSTYDFPN